MTYMLAWHNISMIITLARPTVDINYPNCRKVNEYVMGSCRARGTERSLILLGLQLIEIIVSWMDVDNRAEERTTHDAPNLYEMR